MTRKVPKKSLITGITGQDGAYLAQFLLDKGYEVSGVLSDGHQHSLHRLKILGIADRVQLLSCRLTDIDCVGKLLSEVQPNEIYNLAAISSVGISFEKPDQTMQYNCLSVVALLEAVRRLGIKTRVYQASSSEMFGNALCLPVTEDSILNPISPYAISKVAGHLLVKNYRLAYKIFCCSGILFNHESVLRPDNFVTKKIVSTAVRISKGSREKLKLGNITIKRDWGYAPQYVRGMWLMLQQALPNDYVIASGQTHSLQEFVELAFINLDLRWEEHVDIDRGLFRPSDITVTLGDSSRARKEIGWEYDMSFSDLVKILVKDEVEYQTTQILS
ncbi:MAG: GDP-mannose 4,6-dehydratase [Candidatus Omnitrophica bacterium]|nr:GDP-mannose 4,6-dehydratase [Candidatus Omnitrophota bacterium]